MAKTYRCIVPGCDRDGFETPWGVRVHCTRSHKELGEWQEEWDKLIKQGEQIPAISKAKRKQKKDKRGTSTSTEKYIEGMIQVLRQTPNQQLPMRELMDGLRESGVTDSNSDDALRTRISAIVRENPKSGIKRIERGMYGLARSAQVAPPVDQPGFSVDIPVDENDAATENLWLRRQNQKKGDAIMGLTRIIATLVADD